MVPTNENTLHIIINQASFDAVLNGTTKQKIREIKETTFHKYLETWSEGEVTRLHYDEDKILKEMFDKYPNNPMVYNNGVYPYIPIPYKFIDIAVGYDKARDALLVAIDNIHFEPLKSDNGKEARFSDDEETMKMDDNGELCIWQIVYTLGKIIKTDLKKD